MTWNYVEVQSSIIISSLGARKEVFDTAHSYGGIVLHDVINDTFAHKAIEKGADGLIAVATGAGGHPGTKSPFALVQKFGSGSTVLLLCPDQLPHEVLY